MNKIIAKQGKRYGKTVVTIADNYIKAATSLPIYWKDNRPWMDKTAAAVAAGRPVKLMDIAYMAGLAKSFLLSEPQKELRAELLKLVKAEFKAA